NAKRRRHTRSRMIPRRSRIDDSQGPRPMKSTRRTLRALGGAASLILVGCWTPAPYGYQSYPGPGYYAPPPNQGFVAPPGGAIVGPTPAYPTPQLGAPGSPPPGGGAWAPAPGPGPTPAPVPTIAPPTNSGSLAPLPGAPTQTYNNGPSTFSE